jgi:hypothetical protein
VHCCDTTQPAHLLVNALPFREMSSEQYDPQPDSTSCLNALYGFASSNADMDGIAVGVASGSWSRSADTYS